MKKMFLVGLLLAVGVTLSAKGLNLSQLNKKVIELEKRIKKLEQIILKQNRKFYSIGRISRDTHNRKIPAIRKIWRKLKKGMSKKDVRKILGEPIRIIVNSSFMTWTFPNGSIRFYNERLDSWREP